MSPPIFLSLSEVLEIHTNQIELYGGSFGIRDQGLLEAAVAQPEASFGDEYLHKDIYEMGAAYLYHLVQNHPFIDGNKRVGLASALTFLLLNEIELDPALDELDPDTKEPILRALVIQIASGELKKPQIAEFLKKHSKA